MIGEPLIPGDGTGLALGKAGYVLGPDETAAGALKWIPNQPDPYNSGQSWWCQGSEGGSVGASFMDIGLTVTGTGAGFTYPAGSGRMQGIGACNTGTTTTGRNGQTIGASQIQLSATSGTWLYDAWFTIDTLDDGVDTYRFVSGFGDAATALNATDGAYLFYDKSSQGTTFKFITSSNGTRTTTATGVTVTAGVWYRLRISITNNTTASCFLVADSLGWSYGTAVATNTTNIPTGAGREFGVGMHILKSAGTNSRSFQFVFHNYRHEVVRTTGAIAVADIDGSDGLGLGAPALGQILGIDSSGNPTWVERVARSRRIPFLQMDQTSQTISYQTVVSGTGAALNVAAVGVVGFPQIQRYFTGTDTTGGALKIGYPAINTPPFLINPSIGMLVYEAAIFINTLSTVAQQFTVELGLGNPTTPALGFTDGVYLHLDSAVDARLVARTVKASNTTSTVTPLTIIAATWYWIRVVVRPVAGTAMTYQVDFYAAAFGSSIVTPIATHTTNVPLASIGAFTMALKSTGSTGAALLQTYQLAYQRLAA